MYFHAPCGVVLHFVVCKVYTDKEKKSRLHTVLGAAMEHNRLFNEQPLIAFLRAPNLKDKLVRAKLPQLEHEVVKGYFRCG